MCVDAKQIMEHLMAAWMPACKEGTSLVARVESW